MREGSLGRGCCAEGRGMSLFRGARRLCGFGHNLDFFQLGFLKSEERRHLNDLARADEIAGVGTEFFYAWVETATAHRFGDVKAEQAFAILPIVYTEFANNHVSL